MLLTKVVIISNAITMLGHKPIITLDDDNRDDLVIAAEQAFDFLLPASITENGWRFACRLTQLNKVNAEVPLAGWHAVYQMPAGWLKTIRMHPHTYAYEVFENDKIYANFAGPVYMEHCFMPDISRLPPWFTKYFVFELAAYLALSNAQKADFYGALEAKRSHQMAIAMAIDAQNRPQNSIPIFPVADAPAMISGMHPYPGPGGGYG